MATRRLEVEFIGDERDLERAFKKTRAEADKTGRSMGDLGEKTAVFGRISSKSGAALVAVGKGAIAAGAGVGIAAVGAKKLFDAWTDSLQVAKQTETALKSTGGAAKVTAREIEALATAISRKSGFDDEAVQSAENLLLTFTQIRNEAGRGNKIFNQTTQAAADMAAAFKASGKEMSIQDAAIQLGKALNDPAKGMSRLTRSGVTFTETQKQQVAELVKSGKRLEAQKIILRELNKEFGGSAKTWGDTHPLEKLDVAFGNLQETVGGLLAPAFTKAAEALTGFLNGVQDGTGVAGTIGKILGSIDLSGVIGRITSGVKGALDTVKVLIADSRPAIASIASTIASVAGTVIGGVRRIAQAFKAVFGDAGVGADIRNIASKLVAFGAIVAKMVAPQIKKAIDGIVQMYEGLAVAVRGVIRVISGILSGDFGKMWQGVKDLFAGALRGVVGLFRTFTAPIRQGAETVGGAVLGALRSLGSKLLELGKAAVGKLADAFTGGVRIARNAMDEVRRKVVGAITAVPERFVQLGKDIMRGLINGVKSMAGTVKNVVVDVVTAPVDLVKDTLGIGSPSKVFHQFGEWVGEGFANGLKASAAKVNAAADKGLLFPLEAKLRELQAKGEKLQRLASRLSSPSSSSSRSPSSSSSPGRFTTASSGGTLAVIAGGRMLQRMGLQVAESKWFGGVTTNRHAHYPNDHYSGNSIDVNFPGGGRAELARLQQALKALRERFGTLVSAIIEDAGTANQHLHATFRNVRVAATRSRRSSRSVDTVQALANKKRFSLQDLANLWVAAGGDPKHAGIMARVAWAESEGRADARNSIGATGLWQIYNGPNTSRELLDPMKNARAAVEKFQAGGLQPWIDSKWKGAGGGWGQFVGHPGVQPTITVRGGDGGSIADVTNAYQRSVQAAVRLNEQQQKAVEKAIAFRDAVKGVSTQFTQALGPAVEKFRAQWERTKGAEFDRVTAELIANSPAARELAALQAEADRIAREQEDLANQRQLEEALASGDQAAIDAAHAQIDATARQRRIAELQQLVADETAKIEAARAEERDKALEDDTRAFVANETRKGRKLIQELARRTITYAQFVKRINRMLAAIGADAFQASADEEAAILGGFSTRQLKALGISPGEWQQILRDAATADLPSYDGGGRIPGPPGHPVPILAHGGELVLTPEQQQTLGGVTIVFNENGDRHFHTEFDVEKDRRQRAFQLQNALRAW
ncbi:MAG: phage tail length tape measure family protein [Steroidobacteraceae bacterium]|nr:phage tail length tape measure family protein [Steroidobacteraceae bacterium]